MSWRDITMPALGATVPADAEVVEVPILLSGWQLQLLETAASESGLTTGQLLRRLINEFCTRQMVVSAEHVHN